MSESGLGHTRAWLRCILDRCHGVPDSVWRITWDVQLCEDAVVLRNHGRARQEVPIAAIEDDRVLPMMTCEAALVLPGLPSAQNFSDSGSHDNWALLTSFGGFTYDFLRSCVFRDGALDIDDIG